MTIQRCGWVQVGRSTELELNYHDSEWGVPVHDDRLLFEFLILEGAQAGLSWSTVLQKRQAYRRAFDNFEPEIVAQYNAKVCEQLLNNPGIIRNRLKVAAAVTNAKAFLAVQDTVGSFAAYLWGFVDGQPIQNAWSSINEVPATTPISEAMSRDLKQRGFKFVGPTICYALMQATGLVNDHTTDCFRHKALSSGR